MVTKCKDFDLENKWTFLVKGRDAGVPVTPFMDAPELVCKHINIEGGESWKMLTVANVYYLRI
jgi:hypothetical protein